MPRAGVDPHPEWFRTGDLGVLDSDRNLTYVDRVKDSLRRRGENVSSVEVETVVTRHPAVLEAAVVGVPSDLGEDDILLFVTVHPAVRWITLSCWTFAARGCRTSPCRDMSRSSASCQRPLSAGSARMFFAHKVSEPRPGTAKATDTSSVGKTGRTNRWP